MSELAEVTDQVQTQAPGLLTPGPCHCPAPAVPGTPCRFPLAQLLDWPTEGRGLHVSEEAVLVLLQCRTQASGPERRSPGLRVWGGLGEAWLTVMPPPVLHPALLSATQVGSSVAQLCSVLSNPPFVFHFRNFVNTFIQFKKPIIVAVNGPAIGLGASILPLCDVVWANEKAWFQTPYTTFGQSPDGCSTVMFPKIMGGASVSTASSHTTPSAARGRLARLLLCGRARCRSPSGEFASGAGGFQLVLMNSRSNPRGHRGASGLVHGLCGDAALPHSREGAPSLCHLHREPPGEKPSSYPKK